MNELPTLYQQYIHLSRYSRWLPEEKRRETWEETVNRYCTFFAEKFPKEWKPHNTEIRNAILNLEVMPSMRCMMTAGPALERENVAGYNCAYLAIDSPRAFDEIVYVLMCFSGDTKILTETGTKKLQEVTTKDSLLTFNKDQGNYEYANPSFVGETASANRPKLELEFEDGYVVRCTEDHCFLTKTRGWVEAKDLTESDDIQNYHEVSFIP